jgi:putative transposase
MARLARIAVPNVPYHVTQRGNRRQPVFFGQADYQTYRGLLRDESQRWHLQIWAYCLMTNHVHLVVWPEQAESLSRAIAETHRRYSRAVNFREGWRGYLWQGRFGSVLLDEPHLLAAVRYVERNPVTAGLVERAEDYPWSSARAHVWGLPDPVLTRHVLTERITDWATFLRSAEDDPLGQRLHQHASIGRPLGSRAFLEHLEQLTGRRLRRGRPGRRVVALK